MATFRTPQTIRLSPEEVARAQAFAEAVADLRVSAISSAGWEKQAVYLETLRKHKIF